MIFRFFEDCGMDGRIPNPGTPRGVVVQTRQPTGYHRQGRLPTTDPAADSLDRLKMIPVVYIDVDPTTVGRVDHYCRRE